MWDPTWMGPDVSGIMPWAGADDVTAASGGRGREGKHMGWAAGDCDRVIRGFKGVIRLHLHVIRAWRSALHLQTQVR